MKGTQFLNALNKVFFRFGALNYLLLYGNKMRYSKMVIFMTFRRSLRSFHYAILLGFMNYIIHFPPYVYSELRIYPYVATLIHSSTRSAV